MEIDRIICGDALEELPAIPEDSIDAIVTETHVDYNSTRLRKTFDMFTFEIALARIIE